MSTDPRIGLLAAHDELTIFESDRKIALAKPGNRKSDAERVVAGALEIVGRVAVFRLCRSFDEPLELVETQKIGVRPKGQFRHPHGPFAKRQWFRAPIRQPVGIIWDAESQPTSHDNCCKGLKGVYSSTMRDDGPHTAVPVEMESEAVLRARLESLRREHRDLDEAIEALEAKGTGDPLTIRRLKKQKLALKDRIRLIEDELTPDIIA